MQRGRVTVGLGVLALVAAAGVSLGLTSRPAAIGTSTSRPPTSPNHLSAKRPGTRRARAGAGAARSRTPASPAPPRSRRQTTTTVPDTTTLPSPVFTAANPANPDVAALDARLTPLAAADPGCLEVTQGLQVLFQSNPTGLVTPGSTEKLLVAAAALKVLGPAYTFTTEVVAPAAPVGGSVSQLWLVGGGDPLLGTPAFATWWDGQRRFAGDPITDIATLAASVRAAGVTAVTGAVHGDDTRYDAVRVNPAWPADAVSNLDITPMSALTLDMGYQSWTPTATVPADPAAFAAATFAQLLTAAGVSAPDSPPGVDGPPPPGSVVIATIHSAPLSRIIGAMLGPSDNQIAELLVKELGYREDGIGATAAGLAVVRAVDPGLGIPWDGTVMLDGSGLAHGDRTTCQTLLAALYLGDRPGFSAIPSGLAVAGVNGTLAKRFTTPPLLGHLRAKTGSIDGVAGMVGEIDLGAPVRFAMVFNQALPDYLLLDHEDAAVAAIAPYP